MARQYLFTKLFQLGFHYKILRHDTHGFRAVERIVLQVLAIIVVSVSRFIKDACSLSAAALSYYSTLAVIPIVALILAISKGFGVNRLLEDSLSQQTLADPQVVKFVMEVASYALDNTKSGLFTGIGIILLLWTVMRVFIGAETAMNGIWCISKGRSLGRQCTDFISLLFVVPILSISIAGLNVFLTSGLKTMAMEDGFLAMASPFLIAMLKLVPYILVWMLFTFMYMFIPTVKVKFANAFIAGIIAGSVFEAVAWFYIRFQIGVSSYNAVYGSLAALPLLLVWLQVSWSIILLGCEMCYVLSNRLVIYKDEEDKQEMFSEQVDLAVDILNCISEEYFKNYNPVTEKEIGRKLHLNLRKIDVMLNILCYYNFLLKTDEKEKVFIPKKDFHNLSMAEIIVKMSGLKGENKGNQWQQRFIKTINVEFKKDNFAPSLNSQN